MIARRIILTIWLSLTLATTVAGKDIFDKIKASLAEADCCHLEFVSVIESDVFDQVDSIYGVALIASDGRYDLLLGEDRYSFDLHRTYSFSSENNQVVIEKPVQGSHPDEQVTFVTSLDRYYTTEVLKPDSLYRLVIRPNIEAEIPDSLVVSIDADAEMIDRIEYYDINEELNRFTILKQTIGIKCDEQRFTPVFPDSVEKLRLP